MKTSDTPPPTIRRVLSRLWEFSRGHRLWLLRGSVAGLVIVGVRLALPFPLRNMARPWLEGDGNDAPVHSFFLPADLHPAVVVGVSLLVLMGLMGLADLYQRLCFARLSIGTLRRARSVAIRGLREREQDASSLRSGELVARLIGDTARAKAGLKGFLVHVLTNSVLLIGVLAVLLTVHPLLALLFLVACAIVSVTTWYCGKRMFQVALRYRHKEGKLANRIHKAWQGDYGDKSMVRLNRESGDHEAELTRLQGICTWVAHLALGLVVLAAVLMGRNMLASGEMQREDLLLFLLYAVLLRAPAVKIVRQGARTGKILACAVRIVELCEPAALSRTGLGGLQTSLRLEGVKVSTKKVGGVRRRRLGLVDLTLRPGEHVAVVGPAGAGKTTLLRTLAGLETVRRGRVLWDDVDITRGRDFDLTTRVHFLPDRPDWPRAPLAALLGLPRTGPVPPRAELGAILGDWGGLKPVKRRCTQWETPIGAADMSLAEAKALGLAIALRSDAEVLLLDDPLVFLSARKRRAAQLAIRAYPGLVLLATRDGAGLEDTFDRVVALAKGRVATPPPPTSALPADGPALKTPGVHDHA